jgi:hypothetical protein
VILRIETEVFANVGKSSTTDLYSQLLLLYFLRNSVWREKTQVSQNPLPAESMNRSCAVSFELSMETMLQMVQWDFSWTLKNWQEEQTEKTSRWVE